MDWIMLGFELAVLYLIITADLSKPEEAAALKVLAAVWVIVSIMHTVMDIGKL